MESIRYPLLLEPLFETGDGEDGLLRRFLGENAPPEDGAYACCWQLIDDGKRSNTIANGPAAGTSLRSLFTRAPRDLVGKRHSSKQVFPICVRLLETAFDRPLGLFPEDRGGSAQRGTSGNFRLWYSLDRYPESIVISGLRPEATRLDFVTKLNSPDLRDCLQVYRPETYHAFFAPSGRVHALGAGNLLVEIQQRPNAPLRVSGWGPEDAVPRAEAEAAMEHMVFHDRLIRRIAMDVAPMRQTRKVPLLTACPAFHVDEIRLCDHLYGRTNGDSFHLFVVVAGDVSFLTREHACRAGKGQCVLIPACLGDYRLEIDSEKARLLQVQLP